jgi:hypothetical protein
LDHRAVLQIRLSSFFNLVMHFLYKFGLFAYNLCDTKKASQLAVDGPVHQLSILLSYVGYLRSKWERERSGRKNLSLLLKKVTIGEGVTKNA